MRRLWPVLLTLATPLASCRGRASADTAADAAVPAQTAVAATQPFVHVVRAIGTVTPRPGHFAELSAPGPTRVARILAAAGDRVAAGDTLVEFERAPFDAAAQSAAAALQAAQRSYTRAARLVQAGILPQKDSDQAATELAQAQAAAVTARRAQQLATLQAPLAGVVTRMTAVLGAAVDANQSLVQVADPAALDVVFNVSAAEAAEIRAGDSVAFDSLGAGVVTSVAAAVDSVSRAVAVRTRLKRSERVLRIGESVLGRIVTAIVPQTITVPVAALVPASDGEGFRVFVVDSAGIAHARPVIVGGRTEAVAQIVSGVVAGEVVVTTGAYGVADGARIARTAR